MPVTDRPQMKPYVAGIHAYVPGKSADASGRRLVKLSANENPLGCSPAALAARSEAASPEIYPDPDSTALRNAIGRVHGVDPARIVCGTGSGDLLNCAVQAFAGLDDEIVFSRYAFSLYPLLAAKVGAKAVLAEDVDYAASVDNLLACVTDRTRVVLLDNPNNPTGTWLPRAEVERLHAGLPGNVLLVLDHAYAEYLADGVDDGGLELAARADNVLVMRTFSKIYGLAGERVGWATGAAALVDALNRLRGPFNVSLGAQAAAEAGVADQAFVGHCRDHNAAARARFAEQLGALGNHGLRVLPSEANFVLVLFEGTLSAQAAQAAIAEAGYAVRYLSDLGSALRITIGTSEQMDEIAAVLRKAAEASA